MNRNPQERSSIERFLESRVKGAEGLPAEHTSEDAARLAQIWDELADVPDSVRYRELRSELLNRLEQERSLTLGWFGQGLGRLAAGSLLIMGAFGGFLLGKPPEGAAAQEQIESLAMSEELEAWLDGAASSTFAEQVFLSWQVDGDNLGFDADVGFDDDWFDSTVDEPSNGGEGQDA